MGSITVQVLAPPLMADCLRGRLHDHCRRMEVPEPVTVVILAGQDWYARFEEHLLHCPDTGRHRIILLTENPQDDLLPASGRGLSVYVGWADPPAMLLKALQAAAWGEPYCSPTVSPHLHHAVQELARTRRYRQLKNQSLSARERQVVSQAARGLSNDEISRCLNISVATVKFHLGRIFQKLGIRSRDQLIDASFQGDDLAAKPGLGLPPISPVPNTEA